MEAFSSSKPVLCINDESFIDGGFYDGIPINLAIDMGATEILAVDLSVLAINKKPKDKNRKGLIF